MTPATGLAAALFGLLPETERGILQRCAAVTRFDPSLYERLLRRDGGDLDELVARGQVQRVASGWYRLEPSLRVCAWDQWWVDEGLTPGAAQVPPALASLALDLAAFYRGTDELEELRQCVLCAPVRARELFDRLYAAADRDFDLVRCQDLVDVLADPDRAHLVPIDLAERRDARQVRLTARGLAATEYHQTGRYLARHALEQRLAALTGESGILQLHAMGGMGKTMQLRWFTARHCLTQDPLIPCARIDFDVIDPVNALRFPWLLLLELAGQLNPQITGSPFQELLRDQGKYRRALSRSAVPDTALLGEVASVAADSADITGRFLAALAEAPGLTRAIIVLDTLEEVILRPVADPAVLLDLLAALHTAAPTLSFVLSGRYDLRDRLPGFTGRFPAAESVEVTPFDEEEATRYLARRGVRADLIPAMIRRSDGLPFTLALYGDLAQGNPAITAAEIDQTEDPGLLYCLDRILERIPDDRLRWLLRYGVVPRRLDLDYVTRVLPPFLIEGMTTDNPLDNPALDDRPPRDITIFLTNEQSPQDLDLPGLWTDLLKYAGASSWVFPVAPDVVMFHENLRGPVRAFLRDQAVFSRLHEASARYHTARRDAEPALWSRWTREIVFHRLHLSRDDGLAFWRAGLEEAWRAGRDDWAAELAADLLAADYQDLNGEPALIDHQAWYEAHIALARAAVARARRESGSGAAGASWSTAERDLAAADLLLIGHPELTGPTVPHLVAKAAVDALRGRTEEAAATLARAEELGIPPSLEADTLLTHADIRPSETLLTIFTRAQELALDEVAAHAARRLGNQHASDGQLTTALDWYERAGSAGLPELGETLIRLGRPAEAIDRLTRPSARPRTSEIARAAAKAMLALRQPTRALLFLAENDLGDGDLDRAAVLGTRAENDPGDGDLDRAAILGARAEIDPGDGHLVQAAVLGTRAENDPGDGDLDRAAILGARAEIDPGDGHLVQTAVLRARAEGDRLRTAAAEAILEAARRQVSSDLDHATLTLELVRLHLKRTGNLRLAERALDAVERHPELPPGLELSARLARIDVRYGRSQWSLARELASDTVDRAQDGPPDLLVAAGLGGLPFGDALFARAILRGIRQFEETGARLALLGELRGTASLGDMELAHALARETLDPWLLERDQYQGADRAHLDLVAAEVARLDGRAELARQLLRDAAEVLGALDPLVWLDWIDAMDRLEPARPGEPEPPPGFLDQHADHPELCAAYLIALARRRLPIDPHEVTQRRLADAGTRLRDTWRRAELAAALSALALAQGLSSAARAATGEAVRLWTELGRDEDARVAAEILFPGSSGEPEAAPTVPGHAGDELALRLGLSQDRERLQVQVDGPRGTATELFRIPDWLDVPGARGELPLAQELTRPIDWGGSAGQVLGPLSPRLEPRGDGKPVDLRLIADGPLASAPWELARLPADHAEAHDGPLAVHPELRYLYRGIGVREGLRIEAQAVERLLARLALPHDEVDRILGVTAAADLRDFQRQSRLRDHGRLRRSTWRELHRALRTARRGRPPHVLLLQPSRSRSVREQRALRGSVADAEAIYRDHSVHLTVLEDLTASSLDWQMIADVGEAERVDVIHVIAAIERPRRETVLHFLADEPGQKGSGLTVDDLDRFVHTLGQTIPPLIILDSITPSTSLELALGMLQRNRMANDLLTVDGIWTLLATGLAAGKARTTQMTRIAAALVNGEGPAEIWRTVQSASGDFPFATTALFSKLRPDAMFHPGKQ
ncbi:hypothetical protein Aple_006950 [Acrocarpospora pleiomorpha]|uniref:Uncharacterized protein n=1 Tax=Acrocarpospora pleiomorpha TaxID=90975 RepID=A0A5M3X9L4_9ACTN|nr:hypothetical protein [Acrocarpospora pleiomorpha]GES17800.1 hypothetical protein Aple_006950 [Acrocarpospora pleiomorpha]